MSLYKPIIPFITKSDNPLSEVAAHDYIEYLEERVKDLCEIRDFWMDSSKKFEQQMKQKSDQITIERELLAKSHESWITLRETSEKEIDRLRVKIDTITEFTHDTIETVVENFSEVLNR